MDVSVIIPNYNGEKYIRACLDSLLTQNIGDVPVIVVDNASADGSCGIIEAEYPSVRLIRLDKNYGFSRAVNEGIRAARTEFVILLNNDTRAEADFVSELLRAIRRDARIFSCQAQMRQMDEPQLLDNAGDFYCALGWALTRGKGKSCAGYLK